MKNNTNHRWLLAVAITASSVISASAAVTNLLANGGFETEGSGANPAFAWQRAAAGYTRSSDARTGAFSASLASPPLAAAVMLQNSVADGLLPGITPGDTPLLSFWAKGFAGTTGNVLFSLRYLAAGGAILATSGNQFFQGSINTSTWSEITYNLGVVPAGATSAFIEFSQGIGPINGVDLLAGTVLIDDIVLSGQAIPEPSSVALLGLGGVALMARRRRRA